VRLPGQLIPELSRRNGKGLLIGPPNELLDAAELGLDLRSDHVCRGTIDQHQVDKASGWTKHGDLEHSIPSRMKHADQRLDDPGLNRISDPRARAGIEAHADVRTEGDRDGRQDRELGSRRPRSTSDMSPWSMPASAASSRWLAPASSRSCLMSAATRDLVSSARRPITVLEVRRGRTIRSSDM
jgi:hypothetical protein